MGLDASLEIKRFGYYPKGMGEVILHINPIQKLASFNMEEVGEIKEINGISVCTFLERQKVAKRQAEAASKILRTRGFVPKIRVVNDKSNPLQKGSSILLFVKTSNGAILGGDAIGELGKPSEAVGKEAARNLLKEIETKATVDVHLADILIPYIAVAKGTSTYLTREITEHTDTNIWLTEKILGTKINITKIGNLYRINT
jgi:RNA 3'-terminal phosphate cyclase (ATP)